MCIRDRLQAARDGQAAEDAIHEGDRAQALVPLHLELDPRLRPLPLHADPLAQELGALLPPAQHQREVERYGREEDEDGNGDEDHRFWALWKIPPRSVPASSTRCLLYTSDAADER